MTSRLLVYGLVDPRDGELRYVGKSSSGLIRPRSHLCPSRLAENTYKGHWIKSVVSAGYRPQILVLEEVLDDASLNEAEQFFIAYFKFLGCRLTNATVGGEGARGVVPSATTRAKMSAVRLGRKNSPAHCAAISAALKGHSVSEVTRSKIGAKSRGNKNCVGRELSPESRAKMSESVRRTSPSRGKRRPAITLERMREAARNRMRAPDGTFIERKGHR